MKKLLMIIVSILMSSAQGAALDTFNITLKNLTNSYAHIYFFYKDKQKYDENYLNPQQEKIMSVPRLEAIAGTLNPNGRIPVSEQENEDLKNGKAVIAFFPTRVHNKPGPIAIRIVPKEKASLAHERKKEAEAERKKADERPEGISAHEAEIVQLRAQLKASQDELAAPKQKITALEAQVRALKQELQPGS